MVRLLKHPSAWLPLAMSAAALAVLFIYFASHGFAVVRETDEGTAAHLWQLLMGLQVPVIGFFILARLPREPKAALLVLALQLLAAFPVLYFRL